MLTYFRILSYGKPYFWMGGVAFLALLVFTVFSAVSLVSVIPFLEILFDTSPLAPPDAPFEWLNSSSLKAHAYYKLSKWMVDFGKIQVLMYFCLTLCSAIIIKNIARYVSGYFMAPLEQGIIKELRNHLFKHLSTLGLGFFTKHKKGDIIGIVVSDVQVVQESVISTVQSLIREPITMIVFFSTMVFISWKLTLFTLIVLPITGLAINFIAQPLKRQARKSQSILGELIATLDEFISGIRIVKAFQKEDYETEKYLKQNRDFTRLQVGIRRRTELASPITEVLSIAVVCIIIYYGGVMILGNEGELKASEFIGFIAIFSQFLAPIKVFSTAISKIQKGIASFQRIEELVNEKALIRDLDVPKKLDQFQTNIEFKDVWFKYEEEDVLKGINLSIPKGSTVALVGPSGGGKSTLADLIPRFYDPYKGGIYIDGIDIKECSLYDLRKLIGIVTQEGILFHDTVANNIAYGMDKPEREEIIEAAKVANAHEFIMHLPDQYDTVIGERGTMLSGGQRQRISISRAVLRNPSILILDEATSNLDTQSEKTVQEALEKLMKNRTSLVIAHRLSTILKADMIVAIDDGKIVEIGTHQDLINQNGMYKHLHDLQFG